MNDSSHIAALRNALINFAQPPQAHFEAIYIGNKIKDGQETGEKAICFLVKEKKLLEEVSEKERIPSIIEGFPTDVVEGYEEIHEEVYQPDPTTVCPDDTDAAAHQAYAGVLQGGISAGPAPAADDNLILGNTVPVASAFAGTLGILCIDKQDKSVVGLSANHVFANQFVAESWNNLNVELRVPINLSSSGIKDTSMQTATAPTDVYQAKRWFVQPALSDDSFSSKIGVGPNPRQIGVLKRAYPWVTGDGTEGYNLIDAAICTVENPSRFSFSASFNLLGHPHQMTSTTSGFAFATTAEIDAMDGSEQVVKCGRTFGAVGVNGTTCRLGVHTVSSTSTIPANGIYPAKPYIDIMTFTGTVDPSAGGDSGSVYTALIEGQWKVVGLHFAGGTRRVNGAGYDVGIAGRIDNVSRLMDIEGYVGQPVKDPAAFIPSGESYATDWSVDKGGGRTAASLDFEPKYLSLKKSAAKKQVFAASKRFPQAGDGSSAY